MTNFIKQKKDFFPKKSNVTEARNYVFFNSAQVEPGGTIVYRDQRETILI